MSIGTIYLIRSLLDSNHKIGITQNWSRRSRELEVGAKTAEVLVETVPLYEALEKTLHRRFKKVRIPQTEYFALNAAQVEEVKSLISQEAEKLKGHQADLHVTLARLVYEQESLPAAQAAGHAIQIDQLKRQLDPEYRRQAEQAEAFAQQRRTEREQRRQQQIAAHQARIEQALAQQRELEEKSLAHARRIASMPFGQALKGKTMEFGIAAAMTAFFTVGLISTVSLFARGAANCQPGYRLDIESCEASDAIGSSAMPLGLLFGCGVGAAAVVGMIRQEKREAQELLACRPAPANASTRPLGRESWQSVALHPSQAGVSFRANHA